MDTVFIYTLRDPETGELRYVGKCKSAKKRLATHIDEARKSDRKSHRVCWIRSLLYRGLRPALNVIDEVPESEWQQWEVAYIQFFRDEGHRLVNATLGGEGFSSGVHHPFFGKHFTDEHKRKLGRPGAKHHQYGKPNPDGVERMAQAVRGKHFTAGHKEKIAASRRGPLNPFYGKRFSPEHCRKLALAHLGGKINMSAENRAKLSESNRTRVWTDTMREKSRRGAMLRVAKSRLDKMLAEMWR